MTEGNGTPDEELEAVEDPGPLREPAAVQEEASTGLKVFGFAVAVAVLGAVGLVLYRI